MDGVDEINAYEKEHFGGGLECRLTPGKGRTLYALRNFRLGEILFREKPLHVVLGDSDSEAFRKVEELCETHADQIDFEPLWYWCALRSLTEEQCKNARHGGWTCIPEQTQRRLLLLHHEEESIESNPGKAAAIFAEHLAPGVDPILIDKLTQVWVLNSFEHSEDPEGYSTYFFSSFMSHSCYPNAIWQEGPGDSHVVRARRPISVGDEVCISYLSEEWLMRSAPERRWDLSQTKRFWCSCERCHGGQDLSRGFRCPKCMRGIVFAPTPRHGDAGDQQPPPADLFGVKCEECGHEITKAQAEKIRTEEDSLKMLVDDFVERIERDCHAFTIPEAELLEEFIDAVFAQHFLAEMAWEHLITFYSIRGLHSDKRRCLRNRYLFHSKAYPGINVQYAHAMECYADDLCASARGEIHKKSGKTSAPNTESREDWELAAHFYGEAHAMGSAMYGFDHEDITEVMQKFCELQEAIALLPPKEKRLRMRGKQPFVAAMAGL